MAELGILLLVFCICVAAGSSVAPDIDLHFVRTRGLASSGWGGLRAKLMVRPYFLARRHMIAVVGMPFCLADRPLALVRPSGPPER